MTPPTEASLRTDQYAELPNGVRLHYSSAGRRGDSLLLFLHGFPEAGFAWDEQLRAFGLSHHAVAPDLRGFNLSSKPASAEHYKPKELVTDVRLLIEQLGHSRAILVAHDWGGAVAWNVALRYPAMVERLVILNSPHPYLFMRAMVNDPQQQKASQYINRLRAPEAESELSKDDFASLDRSFFSRTQASTAAGAPAAESSAPDWYSPDVKARYHAMWSVPGDGGSHSLTGSLNYYRANPAHPPAAAEPVPADAAAAALALKASDFRLDLPVRVIWGERDPFLTPRLLDGLEEVCTDLRVTRVVEGSHWLVHEMPQRINRLIAAALKD
jgi:pimeloyl-ACP methyl ester carboxylesterase